MKKLIPILFCLPLGGQISYCQDIKLVKAPEKYNRVGAYEYNPSSPYIWTDKGVWYYNEWYHEKPQQKLYFVDFTDNFSVTTTKSQLEYNGQTYGVKWFVKYNLGNKKIELVNVLNQKQYTQHYHEYRFEGEKIILGREVFSLKNGESVRKTKISPDGNFMGIVKGEVSLEGEKKCSFMVFDTALNVMEDLTIEIPQNKGTFIKFKDFAISNTGKMISLFYYKDVASSFLYSLPIEKDAKPAYLDFGGTYSFNDPEINFYNDEDANIMICYRKAEDTDVCGYVMFDTKDEENGKLKPDFLNFNQNVTKYLYEYPTLTDVYTFPEHLQVYIFQTDLKKGPNRLKSCLKVLTLSDKKIVSQYDAIRDVDSDYGGFINHCYLIYRNDYLYVLFSGLKGNGEDYSFEEVNKRNKDIRMIKYLKISNEGKIEEFEVAGTEGLYLAAGGTDDKGDKILARAYTFMALGMGGNYGDANFVELAFQK